MKSRIDIERARKTVALVTEKIRADADPWQLDEYQSLFKKEISLLNRSRVAAYLLMLLDRGETLRSTAPDSRGRNGARNNSGRNGPSGHDFAARGGQRRQKPEGDRQGDDALPYPLANEDSKWLFFSAGRGRRVSPREILSLIYAKTALPKEDIGAIRIFDSYSFVQVRDSAAEGIMETLNGHVFRGKPLIVNYAKSRRGSDSADEESAGDKPSDYSADEGSAGGRPSDYSPPEGRSEADVSTDDAAPNDAAPPVDTPQDAAPADAEPTDAPDGGSASGAEDVDARRPAVLPAEERGEEHSHEKDVQG